MKLQSSRTNAFLIIIPNIRILNKVLSKQHAKKVSFIHRLTSKDVGLLKITSENTNLINKNSLYSSDLKNIYKLIGSDLGLKKPIKRIECYDISHSSGSTPVGACVVFSLHGKIKSEYRIYNISQELGGNDLESLRKKNFSRLSDAILDAIFSFSR